MTLKNDFLRVLSTGVLLISVASAAMAASEINKTINRLGVQKSGPLAFFGTVEPISITNCAWGLIYMDISTDFGKAAFSYLMAAQVAGKKLKYFDYSQDVNNMCNLNGLEVER